VRLWPRRPAPRGDGVLQWLACVLAARRLFSPDLRSTSAAAALACRRAPSSCRQASATPRVRAAIVQALRLADPAVIVNSFNRPNIELTVRHKALLGGDDEVMEVCGAGSRMARAMAGGHGTVLMSRVRAYLRPALPRTCSRSSRSAPGSAASSTPG
jgi:hypothetical protein